MRGDGPLLAAAAAALLAACSAGSAVGAPAAPGSKPPASAASTPRPSPALRSATSPVPTPARPAPHTPSTPAEPSDALPPPPEPTAPAPSTAGSLTAADLPVPAGWRTVARAGGEEEGYRGNGTWVHARDPRYAASDVVTLGCADVSRSDYADPVAALEGSYDRHGQPGVGLLLQFADAADAGRWWRVYGDQVRACQDASDPVRTRLLDAGEGLMDRRTYPDGRWTEVARQVGSRVTLVVLSDPRHQVSTGQARRLLAQMR